MRIWHQGFIEMVTIPAYGQALERHLRAVVGPGTVVDVHGVAPGTYTPGHTAADIARSPYLMSLHVHQILDAAQVAGRDGYDAMAIAILQNPGLREARSLVDIPVVGSSSGRPICSRPDGATRANEDTAPPLVTARCAGSAN